LKISLQHYLDQYFVSANELCLSAGISPERFVQGVAQNVIPKPSYRVTADAKLHSCAFGVFDDVSAREGEYFSPANAVWIRQFEQALQRGDEPSQLFAQHYWSALAQVDALLRPHSDLFAGDGIDEQPAASRLTALRGHFLNGVFGVCVVQPDNMLQILRKELSQDALTRLTENGQKRHYRSDERDQLLPIMAIYDQVTMPFSPPEYLRCSRKRLLDDIRAGW